MQDITQSFSVETCDQDEQNELQGTNTVYQGMPGFEQQVTTTCDCQILNRIGFHKQFSLIFSCLSLGC